jgi:type I restriction enzyme M protein
MPNLENILWAAADNLRENSGLSSHDYASPVLGLIFLKFADIKFAQATERIEGEGRTPNKDRYHAKRIIYLSESARYDFLLNQSENINIGALINEAMDNIEEDNEDLRGVLPRDYQRVEKEVLFDLLRSFNSIPMDTDEDLFGRIYEYFLGKFALTEGQGGGAFYTPSWLVKLIVNIIEPLAGKIFDPACGSGGMFVQSAKFIKAHNQNVTGMAIYGQEKDRTTMKLAKMNMAIHGLPGDIKEGNTYYQDVHESIEKFDYVMANPPFNTDNMDLERIYNMRRFPFGLPITAKGDRITQNGGNFLWAQIFYSSLSSKGRAGFVMANGASAASGTQAQIRQKLIETGHVDVIIACPSNLFYNVQIPCTLWFYDKAKSEKRKDTVLFIDARNIFEQIDAAHKKFTDEQIAYLSSIVDLYRDQKVCNFSKIIESAIPKITKSLSVSEDDGDKSLLEGQLKIANNLKELWVKNFSEGYKDVPGLCRVVTKAEIEEKGWVLSPGRYIDIIKDEISDEDFEEKLGELTSRLGIIFKESGELEKKIKDNLREIGHGI